MPIQKVGQVKLCGDHHYYSLVAKSGSNKEELGKWDAYHTYEVEMPEMMAELLSVGINRHVGQGAFSNGQSCPMPDTS